MGNLDISVNTVDDDILCTTKTINVGGKQFQTPAKSISIGKLRRSEQLSASARGINEIYCQVTQNKLENAQGFDRGLQKNIRYDLNKAKTDEVNIVFLEYKTTARTPRELIEYLVDLIYSTSDFVTVPLMTSMLKVIKEEGRGVASKYFQIYLDTVEEFIDVARQLSGKPIMGVIPPLPRVFTNKVIDLYIEKGISAFCFNFGGDTVTAESQMTDMVTPLMRTIAVEDKEEDILFYALNAHRGRKVQGSEHVPARDFISFGFGIDIIGDKHVSPNLPPDLYDKMDDTPMFRLFHRDEYVYQKHHYGNELRDNLPADIGIQPDRIQDRKNDNYRLATLINGELQAKEIAELRPAINEDRVADQIRGKDGIRPNELASMRATKSMFESNQGQTTLSGLDGRIG